MENIKKDEIEDGIKDETVEDTNPIDDQQPET